MQDLRVRFGAILALSLLPLLMLAMVQFYYVFQNDSDDRETILQVTALKAAQDVIATFEDAELILKLIGQTADMTIDCDQNLNDLTNTVPHLESLSIIAPSSAVICQSNSASPLIEGRELSDSLTVDVPFLIEKRSIVGDNSSSKLAISASYGVFNTNGLSQVLTANFNLDNLETFALSSLLDEDARIVVFNDRGDALVGAEDQSPKTRLKWIEAVKSNDQYRGQGKDQAGQIRDIFVVKTGRANTYLAISVPRRSFLSWSVLNPFSSIAILLLALSFTLIVIWLATDKLILTHLRKMQHSMLNFSSGDLSERVGALTNPPYAIDVLGKNFDLMADRIEQREEAITDSLDEKETLLREIHHRVKNNLQIIISLLNMQERKLQDETSRAAIIETRSRINAIALVHKGLYENPDLRFVDMQAFIDRLIAELSVALGMKNKSIRTHVISDCEPMEADTATPVALFIVEALTNAVKHGVHKGGEIEIHVSEQNNIVTVTVSDNGKNISGAPLSHTGTGTKLIKGFARQLGGDVNIQNNDEGYAVTLAFAKRAA